MSLTDQFIETVAKIDDSPDRRQHIDALYDLVDEAIGTADEIFSKLGFEVPARSGFEAIDLGLTRLDPSNMATVAIVSVLTITFSTRHLLPNRADFYRKCESVLRVREPDRLQGLLGGLA